MCDVGYWHQVRSYGSRNMAVSVLFSRLNNVDLSECNDKSQDFVPLSKINMVYTYDGYGDQTMGDTDPYELNETLIEWCHLQGILDHSSLMERLLEEYGLDFSGQKNVQKTIVNSQHLDVDVIKERNTKKSVRITVSKVGTFNVSIPCVPCTFFFLLFNFYCISVQAGTPPWETSGCH